MTVKDDLVAPTDMAPESPDTEPPDTPPPREDTAPETEPTEPDSPETELTEPAMEPVMEPAMEYVKSSCGKKARQDYCNKIRKMDDTGTTTTVSERTGGDGGERARNSSTNETNPRLDTLGIPDFPPTS